MFVDSSAFVAILAQEPDAHQYELAMEGADEIFTSALVQLETVMLLSKFHRGMVAKNEGALINAIQSAGIKTLDINDEVGRVAIQAYERFGKGRGHPAQLNLSDCMTYAMAKHYKLPLLCKGDDFPKTDIQLVKLPK